MPMMSKEMMYRIKTAGEYQKKAIHALFPEKMSRHLDVIEKEIREMLMEMLMETTADTVKGCRKKSSPEDGRDREKPSGIKKIDIV